MLKAYLQLSIRTYITLVPGLGGGRGRIHEILTLDQAWI